MNIQANATTTRVAASLVVISTTACGAYFNARYGWSMGHELDEKAALAAVSVAFDIAKIVAFAYAFHHISKRAWTPGILCAMIWLATASYAFHSAGSFTFSQFAQGITAQENVNKELAARAADIARLEQKSEESKTALNDKGKPLWVTTGACSNPSTPDSRAFCHAHYLMLSDLDKLRATAGADKRTVQPTNPVLAEWSRVLAMPVRDVMLAIAILLAAAIEIVSSASGVAFSKNHADLAEDRRRADEDREDARRAEANARRRSRRKASKRAAPKVGGLRLVK